MRGEKSEYAMKQYPMRQILTAAGFSSAGWYGKKRRQGIAYKKPGPEPILSDEKLLEEILKEIRNSIFNSQGYKKISRRLKERGIKANRKRVYRLMKEKGLLLPTKNKKNGSSRKHDGTIITDMPNRMWGTDGKKFYTEEDGWCWFFGVIDHCNDEILGWHAVKIGDRFAALEPVKQACKKVFYSLEHNICKGTGLFLRADHGSQYDSTDFQKEREFLGIEYSPAFVRSPECNGIIERFHRTLQEQLFGVMQFKNLEEAREWIGYFIVNYNHHWIIERLGYQSPICYRENQEKLCLKIA